MSALGGILQLAFDWTWHTSLQVSVLVILILVLQRLLGRRLTPRLRYTLSFLVLCRLLLPVAPSSSLSLENLLIPAPQPAQSAPPEAIAARSMSGPARFAQARGLSLESALPIMWFCGLLVLVGLAVLRYAQWRRTIRASRRVTDPRLLQILDQARQEMGIRRPVTLTSLPDIGSPAVFGFWRIHLLLPETTLGLLSEREWRLVFLHEMTHVRNSDTVLNALLIGVQFLHWFNPFVWIGLKRLRADRELVCDATVVERLQPGERLGYARVLLRLAEAITDGTRVFPSAVPVVSSASEIRARVIAIKHHGNSGRTARVAVLICVLLLGVLTFTRAREGAVQTATEDTASRLSEGTPRDVEKNLVRHEFRTAGYSLPESVLDNLVEDAIKNEFGDRSTFVRFLEERGMTVERFREQIRERFIVERLRAQLPRTNIVRIEGTNGIVVKYGPTTMRADRMTVYPEERTVVAEGHVHIRQQDQEWVGDHLAWNGGTNQTLSQQKVSGIEVRYIGPPSVKEAEVRRRIHTQVGQAYKPADVDDDVRSLYATGLFYNIRVAVQFSPNGTELIYSVQCNPRLAKITFHGSSKFSDAQLQKLIGARVGDVFSERKIFSDAQAIQTAYANAGFGGAGAKYTFVIDEQSSKASVTFEITEKH